jgi:hypothetical protein
MAAPMVIIGDASIIFSTEFIGTAAHVDSACVSTALAVATHEIFHKVFGDYGDIAARRLLEEKRWCRTWHQRVVGPGRHRCRCADCAAGERHAVRTPLQLSSRWPI